VNHVFEHIPDERRAFEEIKRVLKSDGILVLSFPICVDMDTFEKQEITSEADRLKYYGQKDHVRLYGRDYKQHIEGFGFQVDIKSPQEHFSQDEIEKYGLIADDVVMLCKCN
jgi:ubiquinone/menaquinone biosynthesis C-methylase UbiE